MCAQVALVPAAATDLAEGIAGDQRRARHERDLREPLFVLDAQHLPNGSVQQISVEVLKYNSTSCRNKSE